MYPVDACDILMPKGIGGRPVVWDEDGIPLNSDQAGERLRPNRDVRDYELARRLVTWPSSVGPEWSNTGLMRHVQVALPDMLATTVETAQGIRDMFGTGELFNCEEGLVVIEGLHKAWSLLMYGPNRLNNGQLPRHIAGLQRVLAGHEGVVLHTMFDSPLHLLSGIQNSVEIDPDEFVARVFGSDGQMLKNSSTNESCPASKAAHEALIDCLFMPTADAEAKHKDKWLSKADPNKSLSAFGLAPDKLGLLGTELAGVLVTPFGDTARNNLLMSHRFLVGDTSPEVLAYMEAQAFPEQNHEFAFGKGSV